MWTPPDKIRHAIPPARWPSAEEAAASRWFSPIDVGPSRLHARTWVPAMVPWRATDDGLVTPDVIDWYRALRRRSRPACSWSRPPASATSRAARCCASATIASCRGLRELVAAVREASRRAHAPVHPADRLPRRSGAARPRDKYLARFLRVTDRPPRPPRRRARATSRRLSAIRGRDCARAAPSCSTTSRSRRC